MKIRRSNVPIQLEMTPLIDVVFLLLTFFIFALVLMVRADALDIILPELGSGAAATRAESITVTLRQDGSVLVQGEPTPIEQAGARVTALLGEKPGSVVMLTADSRVPSGRLIELADRLVAAGVREFSVLGSPAGPDSQEPANPPPPGAEE